MLAIPCAGLAEGACAGVPGTQRDHAARTGRTGCDIGCAHNASRRAGQMGTRGAAWGRLSVCAGAMGRRQRQLLDDPLGNAQPSALCWTAVCPQNAAQIWQLLIAVLWRHLGSLQRPGWVQADQLFLSSVWYHRDLCLPGQCAACLAWCGGNGS